MSRIKVTNSHGLFSGNANHVQAILDEFEGNHIRLLGRLAESIGTQSALGYQGLPSVELAVVIADIEPNRDGEFESKEGE